MGRYKLNGDDIAGFSRDSKDILFDKTGTNYTSDDVDGVLREIDDSLSDSGKMPTAVGGTVSVANTTSTSGITQVGSITLTKGRWIVTYTANWQANSTGDRGIQLNPNSQPTSWDGSRQYCNTAKASSLGQTFQEVVTIIDVGVSSMTIYASAGQNSGSSLNMYPYLTAIKISG